MLRKLFVCVAGALLVLSVRNARASDDVDDDNWRPDVGGNVGLRVAF